MRSTWLKPISEHKYIRLVYLGKLRLSDKVGGSRSTLEEVMNDICETATVFNRSNFISGHLACSETLHIVELLEGREEVVLELMKSIRKDPRIEICQEFVKKQLSNERGWSMSMCYSFKTTPPLWHLVQDTNLSLEGIFNMMKNTYEVKREGMHLQSFYKQIIETILLKFIYITETSQCER